MTKLTHWKKRSITNLELCDEVDVGLAGELLLDPVGEDPHEALVDLQPRRVEREGQRSTVRAVMPESGERLFIRVIRVCSYYFGGTELLASLENNQLGTFASSCRTLKDACKSSELRWFNGVELEKFLKQP